MAEHNEIGKIGENIGVSFLVKHGFSVVERNYRTKYGEIDIVALKANKLRFVEVKAITVKSFDHVHSLRVTPTDHFTLEKYRKVVVSTETYMKHKNISQETPWQIDLACVYIIPEKREGKVQYFENVSLQ